MGKNDDHKVATENQKNLISARDALAEVQDRIRGLRDQLKALPEPPPTLEELEQRRADLLADRALGQDTGRQLKQLDADLVAAREAAEKHNAETEAKRTELLATIHGLERKAQGVRAEVDELEQQRAPAVVAALLQEAEAVGARYVQAAQQLHQAALELRGIEGLVVGAQRSVGPAQARKVDFFPNATCATTIPAPRVRAADSLRKGTLGTVFVSEGLGDYGPARIREARQRVVERLAAAGLEL